jgi:hypothetical protein
MAYKSYDFEYDPSDGLFHFLMHGRRIKGRKGYKSQSEAERTVRNSESARDDADRDEMIYSRRYDF